MPLRLRVNGDPHDVLVEPQATLLEVLRGPLGLTGTKENCLEAECGVCTVLVDGKAVNSCILLAGLCDGRDILTIEGLGRPGRLHPLQQAFIEHGAAQCGYCTPGMLLTAKSWLDEHPGIVPEADAVREAIAGTLCRCTGYQKIVAAIRAAAAALADRGRDGAR
jgi:carbon-monoxide dehydrogenase small subunit